MEARIQVAERGELAVVAILNHIHTGSLKLMAKLSEMQCDYQKYVTKEMQRNDWLYCKAKY